MAALVDYGSSSDSSEVDEDEGSGRGRASVVEGGLPKHNGKPVLSTGVVTGTGDRRPTNVPRGGQSSSLRSAPARPYLPSAADLFNTPMASLSATSGLLGNRAVVDASPPLVAASRLYAQGEVQSPPWSVQSSQAVAMETEDDRFGRGGNDGIVSSGPQCSRKRRGEENGSKAAPSLIKMPRGRLPLTRTPPDTSDGVLLPPQLTGRSNIATEDLEKLFTKRGG